MWSYLSIELKTFFTNKKNIAVYTFLLGFAIFYAFRLAPAYDPIEKVDIHEIEARYLTREEFLISQKYSLVGQKHPSVTFAIGVFETLNPIDLRRMEALENKDLQAYAKATADWYRITDFYTASGGYFYYNPRYYTYGNNEAHQEGHLASLATAARYNEYATVDTRLNLEVLEEFTAIQTLYRLMDDYLPYVLLVACLLLSVDILLQDRKYPTLLRGYPIADWKKVAVKFMTAFIGTLALFIPIMIGYIIVGAQFGFGSLELPVPIYGKQQYTTITMTMYFLKTISLLLAWFAVIISFVLLLSLIIRNEVVNIIGGLMVIFAEFAYLDRGLGFFKPVENWVPTYTQVSKVITNMRNYYYESSGIVYSKGLTLLLATACILFVLSLVITLSKRYRLIK